jgi:hypothetical protein
MENCFIVWQGQFTNEDKQKSIILELVVDE